MGIPLNTTSKNEHVPEIVRYIRTVSELTRAIINITNQTTATKIIIKAAYNSTLWLSTIPLELPIMELSVQEP